MIKGVNRQMIEVTQTDSPFYERALFVVKPEYAGESYEALHREAIEVTCWTRRPAGFGWNGWARRRRSAGETRRCSGACGWEPPLWGERESLFWRWRCSLPDYSMLLPEKREGQT